MNNEHHNFFIEGASDHHQGSGFSNLIASSAESVDLQALQWSHPLFKGVVNASRLISDHTDVLITSPNQSSVNSINDDDPANSRGFLYASEFQADSITSNVAPCTPPRCKRLKTGHAVAMVSMKDNNDGSASAPANSPANHKGRASKEKLSERIAALQQLVKPYGKTDTASVLTEAHGYIKFLQDQVQVLSSPYLKPALNRRQENGAGYRYESLRSRGLCLVPISCTRHVAANNSNGADYWASSAHSVLDATSTHHHSQI